MQYELILYIFTAPIIYYLFNLALAHDTLSMKNMEISMIGPYINDKNLCLVDSATTHTILKDLKYFSYLRMQISNVSIICGSASLIEGFERAYITLPRRTKFVIDDSYILKSLNEIY